MEDHMKENVTIEEIASQSGYSLYHFCRVFNLCMGVSVMEYIRARRLSLAATELFKGRKVIDIAVIMGLRHQEVLLKRSVKRLAIPPHSMWRGRPGILM